MSHLSWVAVNEVVRQWLLVQALDLGPCDSQGTCSFCLGTGEEKQAFTILCEGLCSWMKHRSCMGFQDQKIPGRPSQKTEIKMVLPWGQTGERCGFLWHSCTCREMDCCEIIADLNSSIGISHETGWPHCSLRAWLQAELDLRLRFDVHFCVTSSDSTLMITRRLRSCKIAISNLHLPRGFLCARTSCRIQYKIHAGGVITLVVVEPASPCFWRVRGLPKLSYANS